MTEQFDPYYQWLGIRPQAQPPDHYQLLGLRCFEDNPETIQHAADRQTSYLRTMRTGEHAELSQKLLDEVTAAKLCLLVPEDKASYDASLQISTAQVAPAPVQIEEPLIESGFDDSLITEDWLPRSPLSRQTKKQTPRTAWSKRQMAIIGGACAIMLVVAMALWSFSQSRLQVTASGSNSNVRRTFAEPSPPQVQSPSRPISSESMVPQPHEKPDALVRQPSTEADAHPSPPVATAAAPVATAAAPVANVTPALDNKATATVAPPTPTKSPAKPAPPAPAPSSRPESPKERLPVPSPAVQNEIIAQINELYKDAKTSAEKTKFAKQLLNMGEASRKPEERFVIRRKAAELASDAGQLALMRQAIESIAAEYKIDALMVEAKLFERQATTDGGDDLLQRAINEDRYDVATSVASRLCQKAPARDRKEARRKQADVERLRQLWLDAAVALKTLETAPDDPLANLTAGRWQWFQKGDLREGFAHLAKGSDELLKRLAQRELIEQHTESDSQLKLADAWWELAQTRKGEDKNYLVLRAADWYEEVNPTLPGGLTKVRVEKRLEETAALKRSLAKSLMPLPARTGLKSGGALPSGRWSDLLALVDTKRDAVGGSWERSGTALVTKQPMKNATIRLPVTVEGDYDLEMQFTRNTGQDAVAIMFPVGANPCLLTLSESSGKNSRLAINSTLSPPRQGNRIGVEPSVLINGQKYAVLVTVRLRGDDASIQVCLDGVPHLSWSGAQKAVSAEGWPAPPAKQVTLGTHEAVTIQNVRLRPISGKANCIAIANRGR